MAVTSVATQPFRCDLCRRPVDSDIRARARRAWQPLIICGNCVEDAGRPPRTIVAAGA
jgi:hypothetical protein